MKTDLLSELINNLRKISLKEVRKIEENYDLQYICLEELYSQTQDKKFIIFSLLNALVSYQLQYKGEKYWCIFSDYFKNYEFDLKNFYKFIKEYNKRFLNMKLKRINRIIGFLDNIDENKEYYYFNMRELYNYLLKIYNTNYSKTIAFAVKIFGYTMRIYLKKFIMYPYEIPIPLDSRIEKISKFIFNTDNKENILKNWLNISKIVSIPSLHIDSILWTNNPYKKIIFKKLGITEF